MSTRAESVSVLGNWPRWLQITAAVGTLVATLTATAALGGSIYGWAAGRGSTLASIEAHERGQTEHLQSLDKTVSEHSQAITQGHDDQIKVFERLIALDKKLDDTKSDTKNQLDRIEKKLDSK